MVIDEVRGRAFRQDDVQVVNDGEGVHVVVRRRVGEELVEFGGGDELTSEPYDNDVCVDGCGGEQSVTVNRRRPDLEAGVRPHFGGESRLEPTT